MDALVSVIIPVYNEDIYIEKCLDSVIKQTLRPIEAICIDDGSTDGSIRIIMQYAAKYPWIRLVRQSNQGAGIARNKGIAQSAGQFVSFLDADDYFLSEHALETLYKAAVQENVHISAGLRQVDHGTDVLEIDPVLRECLSGQKRRRMLYKEFQFDFDYQCYLYQKDFLISRNLSFPNLRRFQDPPFFIQAMFYAEEFVISDVEFYCYRAGHRTIQYTGRKASDLMDGLFFNLQFSHKHNLQKLFAITVGRINDAYFDVWYKALENGDSKAFQKSEDAQKLADNYGLALEPLAFYRLRGHKRVQIPFFERIKDKIKENGNIVLYGAGDIGKKCYLYLKYTGYAKSILWVDQFRSGEIYYSQALCGMDCINGVAYDEVLITLKIPDISSKVKQRLIKIGVAKEKICEWAVEGEIK